MKNKKRIINITFIIVLLASLFVLYLGFKNNDATLKIGAGTTLSIISFYFLYSDDKKDSVNKK